MKLKILKLYPVCLLFLPLGLVLLGTGCNEPEPEPEPEPDPPEEICDYMLTETDPAKLIIGRWKLSKNDDEPVDQESGYYWEFEPDSTATYQKLNNGKLDTVAYVKYWIELEPELYDYPLLHFYREGGSPLTFSPWHYEFSDNCTFNVSSEFIVDPYIDWTFKRIK